MRSRRPTGRKRSELALEHADLVLLDLSMPVLDGFGLAAALRADERTRHVPLVVLTGEQDLSVKVWARELGALHIFTKPFDPGGVSSFILHALADRMAARRSGERKLAL